MKTITFQQANTEDGSYDVYQSMPYPVTILSYDHERPAHIGHPANLGPLIGRLEAFVKSPDSFDFLYPGTQLPEDPTDLVGLFPVYYSRGTGIGDPNAGFWVDRRVITEIVGQS